jgi:hypothetical protein
MPGSVIRSGEVSVESVGALDGIVGCGEAIGDLDRDRKERLQRQRAVRQKLAEALSLDELHDNVR